MENLHPKGLCSTLHIFNPATTARFKDSMPKLEASYLNIRNAKYKDIPALVRLSKKVYGDDWGSDSKMFRGQISMFPEGQFVAEYDGEIVGHCATFVIRGEIALKHHTWNEI